MNERIKELWTEAGGRHDSGNQHAWPQYTIDDPEKFAELIVQECIETLRLVPYNSDREFGDEVIYQDAVKQHFGVEQ